MAVKWETIKAGDVLYDVRSTRMGNTTMRTMSCWDVKVRSIDHESGIAVVSWNGNPNQTWVRGQVVKLRRSKPQLEEAGMFGQRRIKRREKTAR